MDINKLRQEIASEEYGNKIVNRLIENSNQEDSIDLVNKEIVDIVLKDFKKEIKDIIFEDFQLKSNENSPEDINIDDYLEDIEEIFELELEELMDIIEIRLEELGYES